MNENNCGSIKISEEVIASIAITAALEIDGISFIASIAVTAALEIDGTAKVHQKLLTSAKNIVGTVKSTQKGVSVVTTSEGLDLTVQISVKNGYKIPDVALAVQNNVKEAVSNMTGLNVCRVNIIVSNVVAEKVKSE